MRNLNSLQLRKAIRAKFAWPGGYRLIFITADSATLCANCCRTEYKQIANARRYNLNDGWLVQSVDSAASFDPVDQYCDCDHCGATLVEAEPVASEVTE